MKKRTIGGAKKTDYSCFVVESIKDRAQRSRVHNEIRLHDDQMMCNMYTDCIKSMKIALEKYGDVKGADIERHMHYDELLSRYSDWRYGEEHKMKVENGELSQKNQRRCLKPDPGLRRRSDQSKSKSCNSRASVMKTSRVGCDVVHTSMPQNGRTKSSMARDTTRIHSRAMSTRRVKNNMFRSVPTVLSDIASVSSDVEEGSEDIQPVAFKLSSPRASIGNLKSPMIERESMCLSELSQPASFATGKRFGKRGSLAALNAQKLKVGGDRRIGDCISTERMPNIARKYKSSVGYDGSKGIAARGQVKGIAQGTGDGNLYYPKGSQRIVEITKTSSYVHYKFDIPENLDKHLELLSLHGYIQD
eukprot:gene18219-20037_t